MALVEEMTGQELELVSLVGTNSLAVALREMVDMSPELDFRSGVLVAPLESLSLSSNLSEGINGVALTSSLLSQVSPSSRSAKLASL